MQHHTLFWKVDSAKNLKIERPETSLIHSRMQRKNNKVGSGEAQRNCKKESEE